MRVLTKSRYKLGLECPNKLYYTRKPEYADQKKEDSFLQALAQGGFQVEELARMHYPEGQLIEGRDWDYEYLWNRTKSLLEQENVCIFEAAFLVDHLFIRTDILIKKGNNIELIEVKSKSFDPVNEHLLIGKRGSLVKGWKPYLFDIAFQKHVIQSCFPHFKISSKLMMADKSKTASVNGLNQMFRISQNAEHRTGVIKRISHIEEAGEPVLGTINISDIIQGIEENRYEYHEGLTFLGSIKLLKEHYVKDAYINWPTNYSACKACEFKKQKDSPTTLKSGFEECFQKQHGWGPESFEKANTFDIWSFRRGHGLFEDGIFFKDELTPEMINYTEKPDQLSTSHRQWLQIEKEITQDSSIYLDRDALMEKMDQWNYPLHFIDFETSAVALPFHKGRRPYEQIAFQFSHHIAYEDGRIEHANEFLQTASGVFPNFEFIRALKKALENDHGTIFKFATHENSILNAIYLQLRASEEADSASLMEFIRSISHSKNDMVEKWCGDRDMVDLCDVIKKYYYNPFTKGSNSMKAVLPAILQTSTFLQNKYSKAIHQLNLSSNNFDDQMIWVQKQGKLYQNPYALLPPLFKDWDEKELGVLLSDMNDISDGGAALTAYAKLQFTDMHQKEREALNKGLLKYCELDTLAMVMVWEGLSNLLE